MCEPLVRPAVIELRDEVHEVSNRWTRFQLSVTQGANEEVFPALDLSTMLIGQRTGAVLFMIGTVHAAPSP